MSRPHQRGYPPPNDAAGTAFDGLGLPPPRPPPPTTPAPAAGAGVSGNVASGPPLSLRILYLPDRVVLHDTSFALRGGTRLRATP
ncbi:hypothetical protein I4F81_011147 [Pyropia yezoensis]|uniref:Uncharacterized protein n=1 Tax=Pyropia yezoensis TaxID=2788 RepID=A0ACC3CFM3_PYRYE|nr:hypothetical protein I4F81_011147 [Neopyropia yezoensis]